MVGESPRPTPKKPPSDATRKDSRPAALARVRDLRVTLLEQRRAGLELWIPPDVHRRLGEAASLLYRSLCFSPREWLRRRQTYTLLLALVAGAILPARAHEWLDRTARRGRPRAVPEPG